MNWLFLVLLAFCILYVIRGARKGFVRMAVSMVFFILVFVLSSLLNPPISSFLKNNTGIYTAFTKSCSDIIEDKLEETGEELTLSMQVKVIDELSLPTTVKEGLLRNNTSATYQQLAAKQFADYVASYLGNLMLSALAFLISFCLALVLVQIFLHATDLLTALPVISQINFLGGGLLGFAAAMVWIGLFFLLASLLYETGFGQAVHAALQESAAVQWFYDHNILWLLIEMLL
jgi:uncharacterized membrane protein required for colicin V production